MGDKMVAVATIDAQTSSNCKVQTLLPLLMRIDGNDLPGGCAGLFICDVAM
jgi:hypothetical protein